ncbi:MAG: response regulator [Acidobacteriaceae bacterium]|nr:response regulator [Acidobacteriaceae bacterium]
MAARPEILIAEDNPADVRLIQEALCVLDPPPNTHIARDGEEAIRFLSRSAPFTTVPRPNLVFLDYHLPKTDPSGVLAFIKNDPEFRNVAVIVFTTSNMPELIHEAYALGANCCLSKPSDLDDFLHTVQAAAQFWLNSPLFSGIA